ncbi:hypothetical protein [Shewanella sp. SM32]|uniref:hypothetical protein n=1 Tax=Shewanella sp. SM32 TaxID=2912796 RepID=UPI0021DB6C90|nr:hypothetical protein [Shewanella sp. SM32]MCU8068152.1 hypothetical protein [Shewanella sp. SM32]
MFVFTKKRLVKEWPETLKVAEDKGAVIEHDIALDLELIPEDEWLELIKKGHSIAFDRVLLGWHGISDADGEPMEDTFDNRAALYQWQPFTIAVIRAYQRAASGEAARKN